MLWKLGAGLLGQVIGVFGQKGKAGQELLNKRVEGMKRSMTDEFLVLIWFGPLAFAWFGEPGRTQAAAYVAFLETLPDWYVAALGAITAAVFGLGKAIGRR